ncbi:hypothetical protein M8C21_000903 [Ambrosia artemisiifolia]|uniref:HVA22-like protein n=1 Tax=Ambrosia artemisiifolia TaxID=4212 RepID=A0AAD5BUF1_AMBAR|nr:hypothetical protein M8C21_000903 [Ambrosia artemisiifolia]
MNTALDGPEVDMQETAISMSGLGDEDMTAMQANQREAPPHYAMIIVSVVAKNIDVVAGPLVALGYPLLTRYASIKAMQTRSQTDDQQWLTYWGLYSLITLFELTFSKLLEW